MKRELAAFAGTELAREVHVITSIPSKYRTHLWVLASACLLLFNLSTSVRCGQPTGCMDKYWGDFWIISYEDGYLRRALLGEAVSTVFGSPIDYHVINGLALLAVGCILIPAYVNYARRWKVVPALPVALVACGPATMVFVEVLGDPLHIALLLVLLYAAIAHRLPRVASALVALVVCCLSLMLHEASAFLLLPGVYLIYCFASGSKVRLAVSVGLVSAAAGACALLAGGEEAHVGRMGLMTADGSVVQASTELLASLQAQLDEEYINRLGSLHAVLRTFSHVVRVFLWPTAATLVLLVCARNVLLPKVAVYLLAHALPLYAIAHDWGRFAIYTLVLAMIVSSMPERREAPHSKFWPRLDRLFDPARVAQGVWLAYVVLLLYRAHNDYRMSGLTPYNLVCILTLGLLLLSWRWLKLPTTLTLQPETGAPWPVGVPTPRAHAAHSRGSPQTR